MVVLIAVFVAFTLWSTKAPILALYVKLFGVSTWLRWVCFITLFVTGLNFIGSFILPIVACDTRSATPDLAGFQTCQNATVTGGIWSGFISIIEDVIIFCVPIPAIAQLNLKLSKKIGIFLVFFSGIMSVFPVVSHQLPSYVIHPARSPLTLIHSAIVASAVALSFKWKSTSGSSVGMQVAAMLCA